MSLLTRNLKQTITLWTFDGLDNTGDPSFASPTQISGRWEDRTEKFTNVRGEEVRSRSRVYLSQDVNLGDYLFLGTDVTADPVGVVGAFEVQDFRKTPSINADQFERRALL